MVDKPTIWPIFKGANKLIENAIEWPKAPTWRQFDGKVSEGQENWRPPSMKGSREEIIGKTYIADHKTIEMVNAALFLRRPLLVTGKPGTGKSSLAYAVAYELNLGQVLNWPITSRSTMTEALYRYDAIGRLHDAQMKRELREQRTEITALTDVKQKSPDEMPEELKEELRGIGKYIRLGPLGTALLPSTQPRVLLIDEIDKSNIDLPNDLLHVFETGEFEIPELSRLPRELNFIDVQSHDEDRAVTIEKGHVKCKEFPFVVLTSNGERELPPPFLRRCIRLNIEEPDREDLAKIVIRKFSDEPNGPVASKEGVLTLSAEYNQLIEEFLEKREEQLSTDQLLNAIYLRMQGVHLDEILNPEEQVRKRLLDAILKPLQGI